MEAWSVAVFIITKTNIINTFIIITTRLKVTVSSLRLLINVGPEAHHKTSKRFYDFK